MNDVRQRVAAAALSLNPIFFEHDSLRFRGFRCATCGLAFAVDEKWVKLKYDIQAEFVCPNGCTCRVYRTQYEVGQGR